MSLYIAHESEEWRIDTAMLLCTFNILCGVIRLSGWRGVLLGYEAWQIREYLEAKKNAKDA